MSEEDVTNQIGTEPQDSGGDKIAALQAEIATINAQLASLAVVTMANAAGGAKAGADSGEVVPEEAESRIKQAQPKQGLTTGGLETGGLEGAKGLHPEKRSLTGEEAEKRVAEQYSADLSGAEGALKQFRAVREIADSTALEHLHSMVFSTADGDSVGGEFPFFTMRSKHMLWRAGSAEESDFSAPTLPFEFSPSGSTNISIAAGTVWLLNEDYWLEANGSFTASEDDHIYITFELVPTATNLGTDLDPNYIVGGYGSVAVEPAFSKTKTSVTAVVDNATGGVTTNGQFSVQLGVVGASIQNRYGPLMVATCDASSLISVAGPTFAFYDPTNPVTG